MGGWKILEIENDKLFGMKYGTSDFMSRLEIDTLKDFKWYVLFLLSVGHIFDFFSFFELCEEGFKFTLK